jgi:hypothetical protein
MRNKMIQHGEFFILLLLSSTVKLFARHVEVNVAANWPKFTTSYLTEIAEHLHNQRGFFVLNKSEAGNSIVTEPLWLYLDKLCLKSETIDELINPIENANIFHEVNSYALESALALLPRQLQTLTESMLGTSYYAPAIQFFHSISQRYKSPCGAGKAFAKIYPGEMAVCDISDILINKNFKNVSEDIQNEIYLSKYSDWDYIYPIKSSSTEQQLLHIIVYGSLGSSSFCSLYQKSISLVQSNLITSFSVRPSFDGDQQLASDQKLHGYGVFLDIKNMEYKNVDESKAKGETQTQGKSADSKKKIEFNDDEEVMGINFSKLFSNNHAVGAEIAMLRDRLIELEIAKSSEKSNSEEMKVWKMKDLGLQTVQLINRISNKESSFDAMQKLKDFIQNFPKYAPMISSTKVTQLMRNDAMSWYNSMLGSLVPVNGLFLNGKRIELGGNTFNLFDVFDEIVEEMRRVYQLRSLKLPNSINRMINSAMLHLGEDPSSQTDPMGGPIEKDIVRIDVSKGGKYVVHFMNNLEKDKEYKHLPKSLNTLTFPSWNLHMLARNIYTMIGNVDVLSTAGATILTQMRALHSDSFPIRFGFVFVPDTPGNSIKEAFCRLVAYLIDTQSSSHAFEFAENIAKVYLEEGESIDLDRILSIFSETLSSSSLSKWLPSASKQQEIKNMLLQTNKYGDAIANATEYLVDRNLPINSFSFNGIVSVDPSINSQLMRLISREQFILANYVRGRLLSDKSKSIFNDLMRISNAYSRYHPMLDEKNPDYVNLLTPEARRSLSKLQYFIPQLSRDITADTIEKSGTANSLQLFIEANKGGYAAARNAISWLLEQAAADSASAVFKETKKYSQLAIIWKLPTNDEQNCTDNNQCVNQEFRDLNRFQVYYLLNIVPTLYAHHSVDAAGFCDDLCTEIIKEVRNIEPCYPLLFYHILSLVNIGSRSCNQR